MPPPVRRHLCPLSLLTISTAATTTTINTDARHNRHPAHRRRQPRLQRPIEHRGPEPKQPLFSPNSHFSRPRWFSVRDQEILAAKSKIENALIAKNEGELYAPLSRNVACHDWNCWVILDAYVDVENELYGDEPFINGHAVLYDPKYHKQWTSRNNYEGGPESTLRSFLF
ncbi:hypothetical protein RHMOL_Rhmol07G0293000 [Rhododendron molle]|uniref:Uncharacterized protein n=1 Tax=Rhododendron molle TaxID=49168 RepID=A0ACC0N6H6_RHOML|nr:hypothetical protein RHMOL_Rhmol07G0293000 [Rhododendron molle]